MFLLQWRLSIGRLPGFCNKTRSIIPTLKICHSRLLFFENHCIFVIFINKISAKYNWYVKPWTCGRGLKNKTDGLGNTGPIHRLPVRIVVHWPVRLYSVSFILISALYLISGWYFLRWKCFRRCSSTQQQCSSSKSSLSPVSAASAFLSTSGKTIQGHLRETLLNMPLTRAQLKLLSSKGSRQRR